MTARLLTNPPAYLGLLPGLSNEAYHAGPGMSHSGLKRFSRSPLHFHAGRNQPSRAPTPQMFAGTLAHCMLLEPDEFWRRYAIGPEVTKATREWKDFAAQCLQECREPVTREQVETAKAQAAALRELPEIAKLLSAGEPEVSAYWKDPATGILCKCRPDWASPAGHGKGAVLLDIKTAEDASDDGFSRAISRYGYHRQAAWYSEGYALASELEVYGFVFGIVENEYPYAARVVMLSDAALLTGAEENRKALDRYAQCIETNDWPGYPAGVHTLDLPHWHREY